MAESYGQEKARWITTVIMSSSLQGHEISMSLQNQQHRIRYSDSVETGSIIFSLSDVSSAALASSQWRPGYRLPLGRPQLVCAIDAEAQFFQIVVDIIIDVTLNKEGVAFLLADVQDLSLTNRELFSDRIKKFMTIHRNGFLLLSAALHGPKEWDVMFRIQQRLYGRVLVAFSPDVSPASVTGIFRGYDGSKASGVYIPEECPGFLGSNLRIIPIHNPAEAVKLMLTIAKTTSKPSLDSIRCRMLMARTQIVEQSPVWKMLLQNQLDCNLLNTS